MKWRGGSYSPCLRAKFSKILGQVHEPPPHPPAPHTSASRKEECVRIFRGVASSAPSSSSMTLGPEERKCSSDPQRRSSKGVEFPQPTLFFAIFHIIDLLNSFNFNSCFFHRSSTPVCHIHSRTNGLKNLPPPKCRISWSIWFIADLGSQIANDDHFPYGRWQMAGSRWQMAYMWHICRAQY